MPLLCRLRYCRLSRPLGALIFLLFLLVPAIGRAAPEVPPASPVGVCSAIVYDLDHDAILFEQNADEPIPPASLTKILSMYLALDHIREGHATQATPVTVSPAAAATGGSRMGLTRNETVPLGRLLLGMAVSSGNDASHAVAEFVGGSVPAFVNMMNVRARELGMNDSLFLNPHGLPAPGQRTTARDMLTLARAYLKSHPDALKLHNTRLLTHAGQTTWNKNPLLGQYPGADGLKSGWVRASGYNLVFTASKNGRRLLAVILGAPDMYVRGAEACRLLDAGFLVCENEAVSVAAALDGLPVDTRRIDVRKTARDAGLLRPQRAYARAPKPSKDREFSLLRKYAQGRNAARAKTASARKPQGRVSAAKAGSGKIAGGTKLASGKAARARVEGGKTQAARKAVDARAAKRKSQVGKARHAARSTRSRGRSG